jgi:hypothetical protein
MKGVNVSRFDKYDPKDGGFRAILGVALTATSGPGPSTDLNRILVAAVNGSGRIIKATTVAAASGVIIATRAMAILEPIDVMTDGEIVEVDASDMQSGVAPVAGAKLYFDATASRLTATAPGVGVNGFYVGQVIEAGRLVVRSAAVQL